jgi:hypothetical protein
MSSACEVEHGFPGGGSRMVVSKLSVAARAADDGLMGALNFWRPHLFGPTRLRSGITRVLQHGSGDFRRMFVVASSRSSGGQCGNNNLAVAQVATWQFGNKGSGLRGHVDDATTRSWVGDGFSRSGMGRPGSRLGLIRLIMCYAWWLLQIRQVMLVTAGCYAGRLSGGAKSCLMSVGATHDDSYVAATHACC